MYLKAIQKRIKETIDQYGKSKSLKARAARGSTWLAIGSGSEQLLRLIRNMILTRILAPEVFGIMAIIFAINTFFLSFTEIGIQQAIIQNPDGDKDTYLNGAWFLSIGRAVFLYTISYFSAPLIAQFYNNPDLIRMFRVAFLTLLFIGIISPKAYVLIKNMEFKKYILVEQCGGIIGILTTIVLAFLIRDVWALVIGFTAEFFSRAILSYIICPFFPRLQFNKKQFRSLLKFAGGMLGLPILTFVYMRADVFFIGKLRTTEELGLYNMVANLARLPSLFMAKFVSPLFMPAFAEMQNDNERINKSILDINKVLAYIGVPLIFFMCLYAKPIISIIYTVQYAEVSISFSILFTATMMQNFTRPLVSVYLAKGKPGLLRMITGFRAFIVAALMYPAIIFFRLEGAASAVIVSMLLMYLVLLLHVKVLTGLNRIKYLFSYLVATLFSAPIIIIRILIHYTYSFTPFTKLVIGVSSVLLSYYLLKKSTKMIKLQLP